MAETAPGKPAMGVEIVSDGATFLPAHDADLFLAASKGSVIAFSWDHLKDAIAKVAPAPISAAK
jgi:hypothetical protein